MRITFTDLTDASLKKISVAMKEKKAGEKLAVGPGARFAMNAELTRRAQERAFERGSGCTVLEVVSKEFMPSHDADLKFRANKPELWKPETVLIEGAFGQLVYDPSRADVEEAT